MNIFIVLILLYGVFQFSNGNPTGDIKIVGGEDAVLGQFPHQVLWAYKRRNLMCGGSIYNSYTIITAAHCCNHFEDGEQFQDQLERTRISAGLIDIDDTVNGQERSVKSYLIHPDYNETVNHHNDICLLTLDSDLELNDNVKAIALNDEDIGFGTKCNVSGWGTLEVSSSVASNLGIILRKQFEATQEKKS